MEHRECMRHLWKNMNKQYFGPLFSHNMWSTTKTYIVDKYNYHMRKIEEACPDVAGWLDEHHPYVWTRSKFTEDCKVDYINNNLSEFFNSWVSKTKAFQIAEMHDHIRQMIIKKFDLRVKMGRKIEGRIIPSIINTLNDRSKAIKDYEVLRCGYGTAEVTVCTVRYAVNLQQKTCFCRAWQVTGKPCNHALAFITTESRDIDMQDLVHEYFSVDRFRKAYSGVFPLMTSKQFWPLADLGYTIKKPKLRRKPRRPRVAGIKASDEPGKKKKRECTECHELGHTAKKCQEGLTASQKWKCNSANTFMPSGNATDQGGGSDATDRSTANTSRGRGRGRGAGRPATWFGA